MSERTGKGRELFSRESHKKHLRLEDNDFTEDVGGKEDRMHFTLIFVECSTNKEAETLSC